MKSGLRTLTFATPPPGGTQRLHLNTKIGDGAHAIILCGRRPAGGDRIKALDFNVQTVVVTINGHRVRIAIGSHWATLGQNGWDRYVDAHGKIHMLTRAQRRRTIQWFIDAHGGDLAALHRLRRRNGDRPLTVPEAIALAKAHGVVLCMELKSRAFATKAVAEYVVDACRAADYPCWTMALLNMKMAKEKCAAIEAAGGHFCLIFGRFRSQARGANKIRLWKIKPSQIWGPGSAKRWLRMR